MLQQSIKVSLIAVSVEQLIFLLLTRCCLLPITQIEVMKPEVMKYQALADSIQSFEERKDSKGKDTFDLSDWWKSNCETLPGFVYVLRAVLTNRGSPNSCPPERLFSIFNATNNDDQKSS
jgi:hypothetical protein